LIIGRDLPAMRAIFTAADLVPLTFQTIATCGRMQ
jgi:hypothetical protein